MDSVLQQKCFAGLLPLSEGQDLVEDVENLLCDPVRAWKLKTEDSDKYFEGAQNTRLKQRNTGKTLVACLLKFYDRRQTMANVCRHVRDAILGILREAGVPSGESNSARATLSTVTMRHTIESIFKKKVSFCSIPGDYEALLVLCVYCVVEHVLHANKRSQYGRQVDDALRVDRILAHIHGKELDESVHGEEVPSSHLTPANTQDMQDELPGLDLLDAHDVRTVFGSIQHDMDIDQVLMDSLDVPESMTTRVPEEGDAFQVWLESSFLDDDADHLQVYAPSLEPGFCDDHIFSEEQREFEPWELEYVLM